MDKRKQVSVDDIVTGGMVLGAGIVGFTIAEHVKPLMGKIEAIVSGEGPIVGTLRGVFRK